MIIFIIASIVNIGTCMIISIIDNNNHNIVIIYVPLHIILAIITPIIITITITIKVTVMLMIVISMFTVIHYYYIITTINATFVHALI